MLTRIRIKNIYTNTCRLTFEHIKAITNGFHPQHTHAHNVLLVSTFVSAVCWSPPFLFLVYSIRRVDCVAPFWSFQEHEARHVRAERIYVETGWADERGQSGNGEKKNRERERERRRKKIEKSRKTRQKIFKLEKKTT